MTEENREAVAEAAKSANWQSLIALSEQHHITPCLYFNLKMFPDLVPPAVLSSLSTVYTANLGHTFQLRIESAKLEAALIDARIKTVHFKGLTLAERFYGNDNYRKSSDVDLLVEPSQAIQTQEVLLKHGYRYGHDETAFRVVKDLLRSTYCFRFLSQVSLHGPVSIDLHWRVFDNEFIELPVNVINENTREENLLDSKLTVFAPELLLIIVCTHGVCSSWVRLKWIVDVAQILAQPLDWEKLAQLTRRTRSERIVALGLALASYIPGVCMPAPALQLIETHLDTKEIATNMFNQMILRTSNTEWKLMELWKLKLSMKDSRFEKLALLLRLATDAEISDWYRCQLPQQLFFLYRLIHPFYLAKTSAPHLVRRFTKRWVASPDESKDRRNKHPYCPPR